MCQHCWEIVGTVLWWAIKVSSLQYGIRNREYNTHRCAGTGDDAQGTLSKWSIVKVYPCHLESNSWIQPSFGLHCNASLLHCIYCFWFFGKLVGLNVKFFYKFKTKNIEVTHYATHLTLSWEARYAIYERIRRTKVETFKTRGVNLCEGFSFKFVFPLTNGCRIHTCSNQLE